MKRVRVITDPSDPHDEDLTLCPNINLYTGNKEFQAAFGELTTLEEDILNVGAAIFGTDIALKRGENENIIRNIELTIPVVNLSTFKQVLDDIHYALYILSHDAWNINFVQRIGSPETARKWNIGNVGDVLLFSGGLDSFSAAAKMADLKQKTYLVSHVTANHVISGTQEDLYQYLNNEYPDRFSRYSFRVSGIGRPSKGLEFPSDKDREETQRTRSFMFLSLAGLVARRCGVKDVVMIAENGQMAIHLPLTAGRISAFSTHTAHPEFTALMSIILSTLMGYNIEIQNPFLYMTKAEVVSHLFPKHQGILSKTVSCWKASRVSDFNHCGICVPCLIRRIALEHNQCFVKEYAKDLLRTNISGLSPDDDGKRNLIELCEFISNFRKRLSLAEMERIYPELVSDNFDANQTIEMYQRFADEALQVFQNYPQIMALME